MSSHLREMGWYASYFVRSLYGSCISCLRNKQYNFIVNLLWLKMMSTSPDRWSSVAVKGQAPPQFMISH